MAGSRPTVNGSPTSRDMAVARLLRTGALDTSFGSGGKTFIDNAGSVDYAWGAVIDAQNRVVLTGYSNVGPATTPPDFAAARLTTNGQLNLTFGVGGKVTLDIPGMVTFSESGAVIDEAGRILTSGVTHNSDGSVTDFLIVRFNADGTPDTTFGTGGLAQIDFGVGSAEENYGKLTRNPARRLVVVGSTDSSKRVAITVVNP